jgi:hypothetical protein
MSLSFCVRLGQHRIAVVSGNQMGFQFILPKTQRPFIGFDVGQQPAKVGGLLGGHPPVLVEVDRFVCHDSSALCSNPHSANPMT